MKYVYRVHSRITYVPAASHAVLRAIQISMIQKTAARYANIFICQANNSQQNEFLL